MMSLGIPILQDRDDHERPQEVVSCGRCLFACTKRRGPFLLYKPPNPESRAQLQLHRPATALIVLPLHETKLKNLTIFTFCSIPCNLKAI